MIEEDEIPEYEEAVLDDSRLTLDNLVRTLYQNKDGLLCVNEKNHKEAIEPYHNAVCLYLYYRDEGFHMLDVYYVYAYDQPSSYEEWCEIAHSATDELNKNRPANLLGVYGWTTTTIRVSLVRNGDMMIKVDAEGAKGVRISFNRRTKGRKAHRGKKA